MNYTSGHSVSFTDSSESTKAKKRKIEKTADDQHKHLTPYPTTLIDLTLYSFVSPPADILNHSTSWLQLLPIKAAVRLRPFSLGQHTTWKRLTVVYRFMSSWLGFLLHLIWVSFTGFDGIVVCSLTVGFSTNPTIRWLWRDSPALEFLLQRVTIRGLKWVYWVLATHIRLQSFSLWHDVSISQTNHLTFSTIMWQQKTSCFL